MLLRVEAKRHPVEPERFRGAYADERHVGRAIAGPCVVHVDGGERPSAVYLELDERLPEAVAALRRIRFAETARTSGMRSRSRTFGYAPKLTVRGEETCRSAKLAQEDPAAHEAIARLAAVVEEAYQQLNPELYAEHEQTVAKVLDEWRLGGGVFTSGIINRNNKLPYHYDRGNFPGVWSNMLVFKQACTGGDLVCPELDLCFRLGDHSLFMFDGQAILHGVSPFRLTRPDGYRYSIVFYSLQQMWRCETKAEGVALAQRRRTERERRRFA
ncbi:MAG TPA: hypothetical protein VH834_18175 [Solirubrobacteraceae bacterium]|jgi:hypothetical protein